MGKPTVIRDGPGTVLDRRKRMHDALDRVFDAKTGEPLVDKVAKVADPASYTWSDEDADEVRTRAEKIIKLVKADDLQPVGDAVPFKKGDKVWANPIGGSGGTVKGTVARINAAGQVVISTGSRETEWHPSNVHLA
jgi:hypothetical protein